MTMRFSLVLREAGSCFFAQKYSVLPVGSTEYWVRRLLFVDSHQGNCLAGAVARYHVTAADVFEFGFFLLAMLGGNRAAGMEPAA